MTSTPDDLRDRLLSLDLVAFAAPAAHAAIPATGAVKQGQVRQGQVRQGQVKQGRVKQGLTKLGMTKPN